MSHLDVALAYAHSGWPIFPLEPHGKQPLGRLVPHGLKDASLEEDIVRRWWAAEPQANIAVPTGILFDVGDIDSEDALRRFVTLCSENDTDPQSFPRARTGRGGRHIFVAPTGVGNKVDVIPGMDWRGKGGYVVVPDSVHPSGTTYEWIHKVTGEPPQCPEWLMALITRPVLMRPAVAPQSAPEAYVKAAVEAELGSLRQASEGTRNDTLNRAAYSLGTMVGAGWYPQGRAEVDLKGAAYATGLDEPEVSRTIRSGLEDGVAHPRQTPEGGWGSSGGVIRQGAQSERSGARANTPATTSARPEVYSLADIENVDIPEPRAIVPGILYVGLNMLVGKSKLGKSWLALSTALAVAAGGKVLDRIAVDAAEVLYLALEDNRGRMKQRTKILLDEARFPARLFIAHDWPKLDEGGVQAIEMWLDEHPKASMLIIDVWARLRPNRKKNGDLYAEDYQHLVPLQALARRYEVAVLVVHHTRKAASEDVYDEILGTGGIMAALDSCIVLHRARSEADAELFITGRDLEEAHLALKFDEARWSLLGSATEITASKAAREVLETVNDRSTAWTPALTAQALGKPRSQIKALMYKMLTRGELRRGPNSTYLPPLTAVTVDSVDRVDRVDRSVDNSVNGQRGQRLPTRAPAHTRAREGCPNCGRPAYSWIGEQRKCQNCGELYG